MLNWSEEQREYRGTIEKLADRLNEDIVEFDEQGTFPREKWGYLCEMNIPAIPVAERFNGLGCDLLTSMYLLEGLGYACEDAGLNFTVTSHIVSTEVPIQKFGTAEQQERYLPELCAGEVIGAHAITEPDSGSDAFAMKTTAVRAGGKYILNGSKSFITSSTIADIFIIYAATDEKRGVLGNISAFIVEKDAPGLTISQPIAKMGLRTSPYGQLYFDDCEVSGENILGQVGKGFSIFNYVMKWEVLLSFSVNIGEMGRQLEKCIDYGRTRMQFGKAISRHQSIAHMIVDMKVRLEASKALLYQAGELFHRGKGCTLEIAMAKLYLSEAYVQSSLSAIQLFGAYGYSKEYLIEKDLRNAIAGKIYSGSSEIQKNIIANQLGL